MEEEKEVMGCCCEEEEREKLKMRMDNAADLLIQIEKLADRAFKILQIRRGG